MDPEKNITNDPLDRVSVTDDRRTGTDKGEPPELLSPSSQIGRAAQSGGTPESGDEARQGWHIPDQSDTPPEWPEPTTDG